MQPHRIILVGGQTTGHILPMMAVGHEFRARANGRDVVVLGDRNGPEADIVPHYGFAFRTVAGAPLRGVRSRTQRLRAYAAACKAFLQTRRLLREGPVALVAGFGGYISAAPILAARSLGIPTALFEPNAIPGLTNRRLRGIADLRLVGLDATTAQPGWSDAVVSGHPIRDGVLRVPPRSERRERCGALRILVTAGLRGSAFLNRAAPEIVAELLRRNVAVHVHHQAGTAATGAIEAAYARLGVSAVIERFIEDMPAAFARCEVVVCAGGAGTLSEIAALGLPALVVPIGAAADDHQTANARAFASRLNAVCMGEDDWSAARAADAITQLAATQPAAKRIIERSAATFVDHCERLIARRQPAARFSHAAYDPIEHASW